MDIAPGRHAGPDTLRLTEFDRRFWGKYDIVLPGELRELADDRLEALIMRRADVDEARARELLATIRKRGRLGMGWRYDRV